MTLRSAAFLKYTLILLLPLFAAIAGIGYFAAETVKEKLDQEMRDVVASMGDFVQTADWTAKASSLRVIAEKNLETVNALYRQLLSGALTLEETKWLITSILSAQTVGNHGSLFCFDSQGIIQAHPDKKLIHTRLEDAVLRPFPAAPHWHSG